MKKFKLKGAKVGNKIIEHCECEEAICDLTFIKNIKGLSEYSGVRFHKQSLVKDVGIIRCTRAASEKET